MKQILEHCKSISAQICGGGRKTTIYLLALGVALGAASARAEDVYVDLAGANLTPSGATVMNGYVDKIVTNGTLTASEEQNGWAAGTYTLGDNFTLSVKNKLLFTGAYTLNLLTGSTVALTESGMSFYFPFRYGTVTLDMSGGTLSSTPDIYLGSVWNNKDSTKDKHVTAEIALHDNSTLTAVGKLQIGGRSNSDGTYKPKTVKIKVGVTNTVVNASQIIVGDSNAYLGTPGESFNHVTFGPGSVLNIGQVYTYAYPAPAVTFDGAKICWNADNGDSLIGQNKNITTPIYTIGSDGLVIDTAAGYSRTVVSDNASALSGTGGLTKTGAGALTWNYARGSTAAEGGMTFTGPLVVKAGSWTSSLGYAARAFRAEGGMLALSGALTATEVALAATDGGTLTLAGATLTDETPALTLAGGGTTDYFTRDNTVGTYTLASLTLGAGAELTLDAADGTGVDCITADTFTFAEGAAVSVPALAQKGKYALFTLSTGTFASDAAAGLTVSGPTVPYTLTVDGGTIYLSIRPVVPVTVTSAGLTSLTVDNDTALMGAGGVHVDALAVADDTRLVFDPIATPIAVAGTPTFGAGAQIALAADYADVSLGRIVLMTYTGPATFDQTLFDASSIAAGASYTLTEETAPDGTSTQLVLTVGDYANDAKEIRLAPIGDSITQGITRDSAPSFAKYPQYRTAIAARLAAHGYKPVMKGLWTFQNLSIFDAAGVRQPDDWIYHSGVSGDSVMMYKNSGGVRNNMPLYLWVAGYTDVITFFIGTNDIGQDVDGCDVAKIYTEWKKVVLKMGEMRPNAKIICATLLDRGNAGTAWKTKIPAFNELLKADFAAGTVYPANVSYVDLYAACPLEGASNFLETTHPNWTGDDLIARAFYGKITAELPFDTFTPTTDATVTSEAQTAQGAAATVPAEYRNGMTHLYTIDATEINNRFAKGSSAPYTATPFAALPSRAVTKAGYYMELVHKGTNRRRWIWVDIDATGKTLDDIDFPWNDQHHYIAEKVHVASNYEGVHTVLADDDTVQGIVEFTRSSYYQPSSSHTASLSGAPANAMANHGWNDSLDGTGAGHGSFQIHRIFSAEDIAADNLDAAETLFAWNRWGNVDGIDEIGIGTYSCHADGINTTDYTSTGAGAKGLGTLSAAGYSVRHVEIWAAFAQQRGVVMVVR